MSNPSFVSRHKVAIAGFLSSVVVATGGYALLRAALPKEPAVEAQPSTAEITPTQEVARLAPSGSVLPPVANGDAPVNTTLATAATPAKHQYEFLLEEDTGTPAPADGENAEVQPEADGPVPDVSIRCEAQNSAGEWEKVKPSPKIGGIVEAIALRCSMEKHSEAPALLEIHRDGVVRYHAEIKEAGTKFSMPAL